MEDGVTRQDGEAILLKRIEQLEAALRPFADVAEYDIGDTEADMDLYRPMSMQYARARLPTVGDFRRARAALGEKA